MSAWFAFSAKSIQSPAARPWYRKLLKQANANVSTLSLGIQPVEPQLHMSQDSNFHFQRLEIMSLSQNGSSPINNKKNNNTARIYNSTMNNRTKNHQKVQIQETSVIHSIKVSTSQLSSSSGIAQLTRPAHDGQLRVVKTYQLWTQSYHHLLSRIGDLGAFF